MSAPDIAAEAEVDTIPAIREFDSYAEAFAWANSFEAQDLIVLPGYRWSVTTRGSKFGVELK